MNQSELLKMLLEHDDRLKSIEELLRLRMPDPNTPPLDPLPPAPPAPPAKKQRKEKSPELDVEKIEEMSNTELAQFCVRLGHQYASRFMLREDLIALILGEDVAVVDPIEAERARTHAFVSGRKTLLVSLLDCDMDCPQCPMFQALECYHNNHDMVDSQEEGA